MKSFTFGRGSHNTREEGMCLMETVAYLAGEEHSYKPRCASLAITSLAVFLNDMASEELRNKEMQDLPWRIVGTKNAEFEGKRNELKQKWFNENNIAGLVYSKYYAQLSFRDGKIIINQDEVDRYAKSGLKVLREMISLTEIKEVVPTNNKELNNA